MCQLARNIYSFRIIISITYTYICALHTSVAAGTHITGAIFEFILKKRALYQLNPCANSGKIPLYINLWWPCLMMHMFILQQYNFILFWRDLFCLSVIFNILLIGSEINLEINTGSVSAKYTEDKNQYSTNLNNRLTFFYGKCDLICNFIWYVNLLC